MASNIQMPKLGLTMQEGKVTEWVVAPGETVRRGDVVMRIETDKVEAEVEAEADGIVHPVAQVGDVYECGEVIGWLLADGEDPPAAAASANGAAPTHAAEPVAAKAGSAASATSPLVSGGRLLASPNAKRRARELGVSLGALRGTGPGGRIVSEDVEEAAAAGPKPAPAQRPPGDTSVAPRFVPFAAAKAAERLGIDPDRIAGSGPGGRVTRQDVYTHARRVGAGVGSVSASRPDPAAGVQPGDRIALAGIRGIIAQRMHDSLQTAAQLTLTMDVDMGRCVGLREQFRELGEDECGAIPGFTDFVIAATARALRDHPVMNSRLDGDTILVEDRVSVAMAVAVDGGLVVPVIPHTDQLGLVDLAVETSRLAEAARTRTLSLEELEGSTFSVTALGMFGVDMFTPIINQPNAGILGVGRIRDEVAWEEATPVRARVLTLSLTWDHRMVDGAPAAEFTRSIKSYLEQPLRLLG